MNAQIIELAWSHYLMRNELLACARDPELKREELRAAFEAGVRAAQMPPKEVNAMLNSYSELRIWG